jgi:hypothetical protein
MTARRRRRQTVDDIYQSIKPRLVRDCPRVMRARNERDKTERRGRKTEIPDRVWLALEMCPAIRKVLQEEFGWKHFPRGSNLAEKIAALWWAVDVDDVLKARERPKTRRPAWLKAT